MKWKNLYEVVLKNLPKPGRRKPDVEYVVKKFFVASSVEEMLKMISKSETFEIVSIKLKESNISIGE